MLMNMKTFAVGLFLFVVFLSCSSSEKNLKVQPYKPADAQLFGVIMQQDSLLFDAFNRRDFDLFKDFFSGDLEVYQDNTGVRNYDEAMMAFKELFNRNYVLKRELVKTSLEVYPVKNFGAIETGLHTFCHTENGKLDCATFKFMHVWNNNNGKWKIKRLITYGH